MQHQFLSYKTSQISYYRFGSGSRLTLCFHGYGEDAASYSFLGKYAGDQYTFLSIDLPFHGQTEWNEGLLFTTDDLLEIIQSLLSETMGNDRWPMTGQRSTNKTRLTLIGFSLGARVALSLYQSQPETIEKLVLLAPDGLKVNFWYWLSTQTWLGNNLFAFTMKQPGWFFGFLKIMNRFRLVNTSIFKFINYYIGDKDVRRLLYERWTSLRKLKPNLQRIKSLVRQHKTEVRLIYGRHDRIILPTKGEKFKKGIEEHCTLNIINSGHQVLHEKHAAEILEALFH